MPRANITKANKKKLLAALQQSLGVVTTAVKACGLERNVFYKYYNNDPEFAKAVDEMHEVALDFAESQLHKQILAGNAASTIFFLKCRGKGRGYIEKTSIEHTGADGKPLQQGIDLTSLSTDDLMALRSMQTRLLGTGNQETVDGDIIDASDELL